MDISEDMEETLTSIENAFAGEIDVMYNKISGKSKVLTSIKVNEIEDTEGEDDSCDEE